MKHLTDTNQVLGTNYRIDIKDSNGILDTLSRIERTAIATVAHEVVNVFFKYYPKKMHILYVFTLKLDLLIERIEYGNGRLTHEIIKDVREVNLLEV